MIKSGFWHVPADIALIREDFGLLYNSGQWVERVSYLSEANRTNFA